MTGEVVRITWLAVAALVVVSACGDDGMAGRSRLLSPDDAAVMLLDESVDGLVVIDLRTPNEYVGRHLPGAISLDMLAADFDARLADLDPAAPYLIYDRLGLRSGDVRQAMIDRGFVDVAEIDGGLTAWLAADLPWVG